MCAQRTDTGRANLPMCPCASVTGVALEESAHGASIQRR